MSSILRSCWRNHLVRPHAFIRSTFSTAAPAGGCNLQFWKDASKRVDWFSAPSTALDDSKSPFNKWFPDGTLNTCYNSLDRHVRAGKGERLALVYDSPVTNVVKNISYQELLRDVMTFSRVLKDHGVRKGDVVVIYMPMIPEAIVAMLACARIGAVHNVVFGGFAAHELAARIKDSSARVVVTASGGIEGKRVVEYKPLVDGAIDSISDVHTVDHCILLRRPTHPIASERGIDTDWTSAVAAAQNSPVLECEEMASTDPLYVLYTSGTTSAPKGVLRDNGGHAVALMSAMEDIFGMREADVFWAASDIGWVVGHSCSVYGPLLKGCTSVVYEGKPVGTPDAAAFWRVIEQHRVNALFCAPTAFRAIKLEDPDGLLPTKHDMSSLRHIFLAGERADAGTVSWASKVLQVPILDNWWQTETGWPICSNMVGVDGYWPMKIGSCFRSCRGWDLKVLETHAEASASCTSAQQLPPNSVGALAIKLPLPPGFMTTLYNHDDRFVQSYMSEYPGYYNTGDIGHVDEDGYVYVTSRAEDEINISGHRISTGSLEEVISQHPDVCEVAVVGIKDSLRGQVAVGMIVLHQRAADSQHYDRIESELVSLVRNTVGRIAVFKKALFVSRLPKTRSGKILRGVMRNMADGDAYTVPATIEDPVVLEDIEQLLRQL